MKTALALLLILVPACCRADELPSFPFLMAQGKASMEVPPDLATLSLSIRVLDKKADVALGRFEERSRQVLAFLEERGIKREDIDASQVNKRDLRDYRNEEGTDTLGYEVRREIRVVLRDLRLYELVAHFLLSTEDITDIDAVFGRTDVEKVRADLVAKAAADARKQGEQMAAGFGARLGPVFAVSQSSLSSTLPGYFRVAGGTRDDGISMLSPKQSKTPVLLVPSTIKVEMHVCALYRLQPGKH